MAHHDVVASYQTCISAQLVDSYLYSIITLVSAAEEIKPTPEEGPMQDIPLQKGSMRTRMKIINVKETLPHLRVLFPYFEICQPNWGNATLLCVC